MAVNDTISDMLTRIRNAGGAGHDVAIVPYSKMNQAVIAIICKEGFCKGMEVLGEGIYKKIVITLKYDENRRPIFRNLERVSKLSRRQYIGVRDIKPTRQGMGVAILSTSKGVMKDVDARRMGVGGEVICQVW